MSFKEISAVMLPTKKAENCLILQNGNKLSYHKGYLTQDYLRDGLNAKSFHLYFLSDEEIKEGEKDELLKQGLYFESSNGLIKTITNQRIKTPGIYKKIIATTDTSLTYISVKCSISGSYIEESLPQPSTLFIQKYIDEYNSGRPITKVMVEYEPNRTWDNDSGLYSYNLNDFKLKVNLKDHTITIKKAKDTWNREELIPILKACWNGGAFYGSNTPNSNYFDNWIKQNL